MNKTCLCVYIRNSKWLSGFLPKMEGVFEWSALKYSLGYHAELTMVIPELDCVEAKTEDDFLIIIILTMWRELLR